MPEPRFVDELTTTQLYQAQGDSHPLWGGKSSLASRIERLERQRALAGPERFRVCGVVDAAGDVVSSAKLYQLEFAIEGAHCLTIGIGAVYTPERARGRGHATRMLQMIADDAARRGYRAAMLYSDIAPEFYERLGYVPFPAYFRDCDPRELPAEAPFSMRPAAPGETEKLRGWYESSWPGDIVRPLRDTFRWSFFRERASAPPDQILLDGETEVGYLTAAKEETCYWVDEFVVAAEQRPRAWATIRSLAEAAGAPEVRGWFSYGQLPAGFRSTPRDSGIPMLKLLDPALAAVRLDPQGVHFGSLDHF